MQSARRAPLALAFAACFAGCKQSSSGRADRARIDPPTIADQSNEPEAGCERGNAGDCFEAGVKYDSPEQRTPDLARAADYYRKACDLGNPTACDNLGLMHSKGEAVPKDAELAFKLFGKGCEAGYPNACFHLGRAHQTGSGTPASAVQAARYYARVCAADPAARPDNPVVAKTVAIACFDLGSMKLRGLGIPVDIGEGRRLVELGCTRGNADSCTTWGVALTQAWGSVPADLERAAELYRRGCEGGSVDGCYNLAVAYRDGDGLPRNPQRADETFAKACALGLAAACTRSKAPDVVPRSRRRTLVHSRTSGRVTNHERHPESRGSSTSFPTSHRGRPNAVTTHRRARGRARWRSAW